MEAIWILLTVLATVSSRTIPSTDYMPSEDQLREIFGDDPPSHTNIETVINKPSKDLIYEIFGKNNTKLPSKTYDNGKDKLDDPERVELSIKINVNTDCDKGMAINETIKLNKNINSTGDDSKQVKVDAGKGVVKPERNFDDRVALGVDSCPAGEVRVGTTCVEPD